MRHVLVGFASMILTAAIAVSAGSPAIVVEDWSTQPSGGAGIPDGWTGQSWGSPRYDFTVVTDGAARVLHLKSRGDNSPIS